MAETHTDRIDDNFWWAEDFLGTAAGPPHFRTLSRVGSFSPLGNPEVPFPIQRPGNDRTWPQEQ